MQRLHGVEEARTYGEGAPAVFYMLQCSDQPFEVDQKSDIRSLPPSDQ